VPRPHEAGSAARVLTHFSRKMSASKDIALHRSLSIEEFSQQKTKSVEKLTLCVYRLPNLSYIELSISK
jgi:hypothetical protein